MNNETRQTRRRRNSIKSSALLISILLLINVTLCGTIAYLAVSDTPLVNEFKPSVVTTSVSETFKDGVKSGVNISNTGNTSAWIRAAVVVTWKNASGEVYGQAPVAGTDYTNWTPGTAWVKGTDGFYYYTKPVAAKSSPEDALIATIGPLGPAPETGYFLTVEIIGSGIQSKPAKVFNDNWKSSGLTVQNSSDSNPMNWTLG